MCGNLFLLCFLQELLLCVEIGQILKVFVGQKIPAMLSRFEIRQFFPSFFFLCYFSIVPLVRLNFSPSSLFFSEFIYWYSKGLQKKNIPSPRKACTGIIFHFSLLSHSLVLFFF